jgi:hypothetical protein
MQSKSLAHSKLAQHVGELFKVYNEENEVVARGKLLSVVENDDDSHLLRYVDLRGDELELMLEGWELVYPDDEESQSWKEPESSWDDDERFDSVRNGDFR